MTKISYAIVALALAAGCSSSDATDIADVSMNNGQTVHVFREGPMPAAGVMTTIVVKAVDGAKPDAVLVWVGTEDSPGSAKVAGVYDSGDGDFDCDITCPTPLPSGAQIWLTLTEGDTVMTQSVAIK